MSYSKADYAGCKFNPSVDREMLSEYPELRSIFPEDFEHGDMSAIARFIVMAYDPASPWVTNEKDIVERKQKILEYLGIDEMEFCDSLMKNTDKGICMAIFTYLVRYIKSREWAAIVALEFCYWESIQKLMEPILETESAKILTAVQKKSAIKTEVKNDMASLDGLYRDFFAGDDEIVKQIKKSRFTPERIGNV